jgi:hypothetical protein
MAIHFVRSELYQAGTTEDGQPFIAESFVIVREFDDGTREAYKEVFKGAEAYKDEHGFFAGYADIRKEAREAAEALLPTVVDTKSVDWYPLERRYC